MRSVLRSSLPEPRPWPALAWGALLVLVVCLSVRGYHSFQLGTYRDDAHYVLLAQSLVAQDTYGLHSGSDAVAKYPFGFPLLLAPFVWLWPDDADAGKALSLTATLANISLLFWGWSLLAQRGSRWWGAIAAALYGLSPVTIAHSHMVMSEAAFMTCTLAALLLGQHCARRRAPRSLSVGGLGLALAGVVSIRVVGVVVPAALFVGLGASRPRALRPLCAALLIAGALLAAVVAFTPVSVADLVPTGYLQELPERWAQRSASDRATSGAASERTVHGSGPEGVMQAVRQLLIPFGGGGREAALARRLGYPSLPIVLDLAVTIIVLAGIWEGRRKLAFSAPLLFFELFYVATLLLWSRPGVRLLYPIQPFLAVQLVLGVRCLARGAFGARSAAVLATSSCVMLIALSTVASLRVIDSRRFIPDFNLGTQWLRTHSAPDATIMAYEPEIIHLYARRATVDVPAFESAEELARFLRERNVAYVLVRPRPIWQPESEPQYGSTRQALVDALEDLTRRGTVELVFDSPEKVRIYAPRAGPRTAPR